MDEEIKRAQPILSQSLFRTSYLPVRTWRSYLTSTVIHGALIAVLLLLTVPAIREVQKRQAEHIALIAPLPAYRPNIVATHRPLENPPLVVRKEAKPRVEPLKPVEVKPVTAQKRELAAAPDIKPEVTPARPLPELKTEMPAPKPPVQTGTFQTVELAKGQTAQKDLKLGGFGDPHGVPPSANPRPSAATLAAVGSFDMSPGTGTAGGGGHSAGGGVRETSFGSAGNPSGVPGGTGRGNGAVHTGGFGEAALSHAAAPADKPKPMEPATSPVEILSKPKPRYTEEARNLKLEGQVSLDVVFQANGSVRILRIIHGLGHGLDEAAQQAALQVRFRPATRGGVPIDSNATIHITFQLT